MTLDGRVGRLERLLLALAEREHLRACIDAPLDDPADHLAFIERALNIPLTAAATTPTSQGAPVQYEYLTPDEQLAPVAERIKALEREHFNRTLDAEANGTEQSRQLVDDTEARLQKLKDREKDLKSKVK